VATGSNICPYQSCENLMKSVKIQTYGIINITGTGLGSTPEYPSSDHGLEPCSKAEHAAVTAEHATVTAEGRSDS